MGRVLGACAIVIAIAFPAAESNTFRIRKCCAENELMSERTRTCVEYKLLNAESHAYRFVNDSAGRSLGDVGFDAPWWFPPQTNIISRKSNATLTKFPRKYELVSGQGQPCGLAETSFLPTYYYRYTFYDDGSISVYPNDTGDARSPTSPTVTFDPMSFCIDRLDLEPDDGSGEEYGEPALDFSVTVDYVVMLCPCIKATCILKCCQPRMILDMRDENAEDDPCVRDTRGGGDDWTPIYVKSGSNAPDYYLLHAMPECKAGEDVVLPNYSDRDPEYVIFSNGSARVAGETFENEYMQFCGENIIDGDDRKIRNRILRCYPRTGAKGSWTRVRRLLYGWLFIIGAIFLLVTLVVYLSLPSLRKLIDTSLVSQTWSLFFGYVSVAVWQLGAESLPRGACIFLGFLIQYCFLSAFFWLNILCFDISYTFSSLRTPRCRFAQQTLKKQIYYFCYGWIIPAVIVCATAVVEFYPGNGDNLLRPGFGDRCWFKKGSLAQLAYFYGPIAILLAANLFLFLYTSYKIMQAQNDISTTLKGKCAEKQRFLLYLKLFVLMGLSWTTELISWALNGEEFYWVITDAVNLLRAVFIFVIICCKRQVVDELKKRFCFERRRKDSRRASNTKSSGMLGSSQCVESKKVQMSANSSM